MLVYFAFEFQSSPLWYMPVRMMELEGLLYHRLIDKKILSRGKIPLIFPIVVYNGLGLWTSVLSTEELIEEHPGLESIRPRFSYLLLDLQRLPPERLAADGKEEGEREGEAKLLKRLAQRKFGALSGEIRARIEAAGAEQLLDWADRILLADTLDEVFSPAR